MRVDKVYTFIDTIGVMCCLPFVQPNKTAVRFQLSLADGRLINSRLERKALSLLMRELFVIVMEGI